MSILLCYVPNMKISQTIILKRDLKDMQYKIYGKVKIWECWICGKGHFFEGLGAFSKSAFKQTQILTNLYYSTLTCKIPIFCP